MLKNIENQSSALTPGNKRSADVMLQQYVGSPMISPSNETVVSDTQSDTENYTFKRPRVNSNGQINGVPMEKISPSRVIHVRNLPPDTSESEVMSLARLHGRVTNLILMRNKRQAFVEMHEIDEAVAFLRYHQNPVCPALIRGQTVQLQYSATYTELKPGQRSHANGMKPTPVLHVNVDNLLVPITLPILHQIFSRHGIVEKIITFTKNNQFQSLIQMSDVNCAQAAKQELDGKNVFSNCCVLRIDFSKMISVNVKYNNDKSRDFTNPDLPSGDDNSPGPPQVVTPTTSMQLGAAPPHMPHMMSQVRPLGMVPFASAMNPNQVVNPLSALSGLGGYQLMSGINPTMLQGYGLHTPALTAAQMGSQHLPSTSTAQNLAQRTLQFSPPRLPISHLTLPDNQLSTNHMHQLHMHQMLMNQFQGLPTSPLQMPAYTTNQNQPKMPQFPLTHQIQAHQMLLNQASLNPAASSPAGAQLQGHPITASHLPDHQLVARHLQAQQPTTSEHQFIRQFPPTASAGLTMVPPPPTTSPDLGAPSTSPQNSTSPVVLVSNLNAKKVSPDALFTLFGMYGDVMRVKILYHKLDTAMVQYEDHSMALLACKYLDRAVFWENEIRVMLSKHYNIQMPSSESHKEGFKLTKDYVCSELHRYHKRGSRNLSNIYAPSNTLHLSNIPNDITDESKIVAEFCKHGTVEGFKFFHNDKRMALIQMSTIPEATATLIEMHNFPISNTHNLRVSFSKSSIHI